MPLPLLLIPILTAAGSTAAATSTAAVVGMAAGGTAVVGGGGAWLWWRFFRTKSAPITAVLQDNEPSNIQLLIINHPIFSRLTNQAAQIHGVQLELGLKKIASYYPWVYVTNFAPNLIMQVMVDLREELGSYHREFATSFDQYMLSYEARVTTAMNIATTSAQSNYRVVQNKLIESAQALWKRLEKYRLQITTWPMALFGPEAPSCQAEINAINGFAIDFEQKLGKLSDAVMRIPADLGGRSHFFSLGRYLSTLSSLYGNRANPISSNSAEKIKVVQKIVSHPDSSERVRMGLVIALIREITDQRTDQHFLTLLVNALKYTACSNPCDSEELQSITEDVHLSALALR